jgi:hypothetical protein
MQSGSGRPAASAARAGVYRRRCGIGVLLLGLATSGCVGSGQIANLIDTRRPSVAFESIDGPPPAVFQKFVKSLKDEAGARQITVVAPSEANYRLRGYLAAHDAGAGSTISWALDVYDADQRRAFRLSGEERAAGRAWAAADDQVLARIARTSMDRFAQFAATARPPSAAAAPAQRTSSALGWLDDWTPESSGIFRILRREPARPPEIAADAGAQLPPDQVPLPTGRPAPAGGPSGAAFAFAPEDR